MLSAARTLPLKRIAIFGFALNMVWEFVQCAVLYDMWDWPFWDATFAMWGAIFGDVLIALSVAVITSWIVRPASLDPPRLRGWLALIGVGFPLSVVLEWIPRSLGWWEYSPYMPAIQIGGYAVGLSPVAQITFLPALSVYLGTRRDV